MKKLKKVEDCQGPRPNVCRDEEKPEQDSRLDSKFFFECPVPRGRELRRRRRKYNKRWLAAMRFAGQQTLLK